MAFIHYKSADIWLRILRQIWEQMISRKKSAFSFSICILWKFFVKSTDYVTQRCESKSTEMYWIIFTKFVVISHKNCFQLFCEIKLPVDSLALWKMSRLCLKKFREINSIRIILLSKVDFMKFSVTNVTRCV